MSHTLFKALSTMKVRELDAKNFSASLSSIYSEDSKVLYRIITRDILKQEGILLTVITGHLYKDYVLSLILEREGINTKKQHFQSFNNKLNRINELGYLDSDEYIFLSEVNKLRNKLAHDVFFDLNKWNVELLPQIKKYDMKVPKQKFKRLDFIEILLKIGFMDIYSELSDRNTWLNLENKPQN